MISVLLLADLMNCFRDFSHRCVLSADEDEGMVAVLSEVDQKSGKGVSNVLCQLSATANDIEQTARSGTIDHGLEGCSMRITNKIQDPVQHRSGEMRARFCFDSPGCTITTLYSKRCRSHCA